MGLLWEPVGHMGSVQEKFRSASGPRDAIMPVQVFDTRDSWSSRQRLSHECTREQGTLG